MAASVPILRSLLRQPQESMRQPLTTSPKRAATAESVMQSQSTVVIETSNRGSSEKRISFWGLLGEDEKGVGHVMEGSGQIWRVNEVAVEYEPRRVKDV